MIRLKNVEKRFGDQIVLCGVNAEFSAGITALLGASGGGKTTLLRLIAGLEAPDAGTISGTKGKKICFLFQEPRLLPWLTAEQNVRTVQEKHSSVGAGEWLKRVGLSGAENKFPAELSGGMCQRVALARALAFGGDCFLLDEPFKEIDAAAKLLLFPLLKRETEGKPVVLVTHTEEEARLLCDRAFRLENGVLCPAAQ
ncbi:MAG: ABC transporter ATP-binding protein [Acutalibacteraceae bacterium]|jgi:ABC-type nitrate/sulfonate/bicarbonate transport system ATPase subunit